MKSIQTRKMTAGLMAFALSLTLAAGAALAQGPRGRGARAGGPDGGFLGPRMGAALGLSDAQKSEIRGIFKSSFDANRAIHEQLKPIREQEKAAVKAGATDAELASLASSAAPLMAQLHASHLSAMAKAYKVLTPEQREKLETMRANMRDRFERKMGPRRAPAQ